VAGHGGARRPRLGRGSIRIGGQRRRRHDHLAAPRARRRDTGRLWPRDELSREGELAAIGRRRESRARHTHRPRCRARGRASAPAHARARRRLAPGLRRAGRRRARVSHRERRGAPMSWRWLPNAICVLRLLLAVPLAVLLIERSYVAALCVLVIAGVSDGLDGFLAKTFDWRTRLGGLLDPAADKLLLVTAFCSLTYVGLTPLDLTAVVIGRDVVIVAGALTYQVLIAPVQGEPARISKLNTACQLGFFFFTITNAAFGLPPRISLLVLGAAVVFTSLVSGLTYVLRWSARAWRVAHGAA